MVTRTICQKVLPQGRINLFRAVVTFLFCHARHPLLEKYITCITVYDGEEGSQGAYELSIVRVGRV